MEKQADQKKSIWGSWWEPLRKWVYPAWLIYETSIRFYEYALSVQDYMVPHQDSVAQYIGEFGAQALTATCTIATFMGCTAFLTVPACLVLFKLFKEDNLTDTRLEQKLKYVL